MTKSILTSVVMVSLCISAAFHYANADDQADKYDYTIKQSKPSLGTNFKSVIVIAGRIPLDKHYDQLSADEINDLKSNYEKMPEADEPPFPVDGLMPIYKAIGTIHETLRLQNKGKLVMYVLIDSEGNPKSVSVSASPDPQITKAVGLVAMMQKYKPAVCSGKPCSMQFPITADLVGPKEDDMDGQNPSVQINRTN